MKLVGVQAGVVVVHADQDARQLGVRAGAAGERQRQRRPVVVEHPAEAAAARAASGRSRGRSGSRGRSSGRACGGPRRVSGCTLPAFDGVRRRHQAAGEIEVQPRRGSSARSTGLPVVHERRRAPGFDLGRMVVVREAVEPLAEDLPDEQAAARLELADVARGVRIAPAVVADRLVAELGPLVQRQADSRCRGTCRGARPGPSRRRRRGRGCRRAPCRPSPCGRRRSCAARIGWMSRWYSTFTGRSSHNAGRSRPSASHFLLDSSCALSVSSGVVFDQVQDLVVGLRRQRCARSRSASGCGRGSRRSRCGSRPAAAGARSGPCSAPCRRLSSVWNVNGDVGGNLGQEAGVGVAVGVERLLAVRRTCARGISPRMRSRSLAWL